MITITTKTNLHLWLLTGRYDGFANDALNSGIGYTGTKPPDEVVIARELLRLNDQRSDFYVMGASASAMASVASMRRLPDDRNLTFVSDLVRCPPSLVSGSVMVGCGDKFSRIDGAVAGKEGFTTIEVKRKGDVVTIKRNDGRIFYAEFSLRGNLVSIPELSKHGVYGDFIIPDSAGDWSFSMTVAPTRYPYADMVTRIQERVELTRLMLEEGTMEAFVSSVQPIHKVGALVVAVMLRMAKTAVTFESEFGAQVDEGLGGIPDGMLTVDWLPIKLDGSYVTYNDNE